MHSSSLIDCAVVTSLLLQRGHFGTIMQALCFSPHNFLCSIIRPGATGQAGQAMAFAFGKFECELT